MMANDYATPLPADGPYRPGKDGTPVLDTEWEARRREVSLVKPGAGELTTPYSQALDAVSPFDRATGRITPAALAKLSKPRKR